MPRPPPVRQNYRQAMDRLTATHLTIVRLLEVATALQDQLRLLAESLATIVRQDNGRSR